MCIMIHIILHLSQSTDSTIPGGNFTINYGLWMILVCHHYINSSVLTMYHSCMRGHRSCDRLWLCGSIWETFVPSSSFFDESNIALKNSLEKYLPQNSHHPFHSHGMVFTNDSKLQKWASAHLGMDCIILARMYLVFHLLGFPSEDAIIAFWHQIKEHLIILSRGSSDYLESADQLSLPSVDNS